MWLRFRNDDALYENVPAVKRGHISLIDPRLCQRVAQAAGKKSSHTRHHQRRPSAPGQDDGRPGSHYRPRKPDGVGEPGVGRKQDSQEPADGEVYHSHIARSLLHMLK